MDIGGKKYNKNVWVLIILVSWLTLTLFALAWWCPEGWSLRGRQWDRFSEGRVKRPGWSGSPWTSESRAIWIERVDWWRWTREAEHGGQTVGSSPCRVTPQRIVQVRWSQVSPSIHQPLGIAAVTEQLGPPSFLLRLVSCLLSLVKNLNSPEGKKEQLKLETSDGVSTSLKLC